MTKFSLSKTKIRLQNLFCHYEKEIRNGLKDISKGSRSTDEEINKLFYYFLYCLQPAIRNRIRIFSLDSDHDLDDTIFEAIIQGSIESLFCSAEIFLFF